MPFRVLLFLIILFGAYAEAQSGPCTESVIKAGNLRPAADAFVYMPPYGKPVVGQSNIRAADTKSFSDTSNIKRSWSADHRIVASPSGDMAYEQGTMQMNYDSKAEGHQDFKAVMLIVYKAKGAECQQAALTMQPMEEDAKR